MIAYDEILDGRRTTVVVNERGDELGRRPAELDVEMIRQALVSARSTLRTAAHDVTEPRWRESKARVLARREEHLSAAIGELDRFAGRVLSS